MRRRCTSGKTRCSAISSVRCRSRTSVTVDATLPAAQLYWRGKFHAGDCPDLTGGVGHPGPLKRASSTKFAAALLGKADRRGNLYPTKTRPDQKIDVAVALMMAIGRAMVEDEQAKGLDGFLSNPIFG